VREKLEQIWKTMIWQQFGAAIDMLENSMIACPKELWGTELKLDEFWYITYHTLFFLDFYMSEKEGDFQPPAPFTLSELDPAGILPERIYRKDELLTYLGYGRDKAKKALEGLNPEMLHQRCNFKSPDVTKAELYLYTMRHVQHHAAQLNLLLSKKTGSAPRWVKKTEN
jgi:hypothetical protein